MCFLEGAYALFDHRLVECHGKVIVSSSLGIWALRSNLAVPAEERRYSNTLAKELSVRTMPVLLIQDVT